MFASFPEGKYCTGNVMDVFVDQCMKFMVCLSERLLSTAMG